MFERLKRWWAKAPSVAEAPRAVVGQPASAREPEATGEVVRLQDVVEALGRRGEALPVDALAGLGRALVGPLAASGEHLVGTSLGEVLLARTGAVRVVGRRRPDGRRRALAIGALSPEHARGTDVGVASDVYSVCALLFGAASGRPPVEADGDVRTLEAILAGRRSALDALRSDLPRRFVEVVHRGLALAPSDRFATLEALDEALAPFEGGAGQGRHALAALAFSVASPGARRPRAPVETADGAMLEAIARGDEAMRLVYADHLEERGRLDEARWLRLEAEVQRAPHEAQRALLRQLGALRAKVPPAFIASVGRAALEGCPVVFGFRCPMRWEQLAPTDEPTVRFCGGCDSTVTYFSTLEEAQLASAGGACVAVDVSVPRWPGDLAGGGMTMGRIG